MTKYTRHETKWRNWFAWYPVYIWKTNEWAWFKTIQRKTVTYHGSGWPIDIVTYQKIS